MSGNSFIERLQAARHSTLLMCVAASQKPMQSASDLPPPPGALGFDWLGLPPLDEVSGERASEEPPEEPPPVAELMGKASDMGDSGGTNDPGCSVVGVVGVVVAAGPTGGVGPAEGVADDDVDAAAGVLGPTLGAMVGKVVGVGLVAATGADARPAEERACASATSGSSSKRAMVARAVDLGMSIAITMALPAVPEAEWATAMRHAYRPRLACEAGGKA
jgi:hypothetical protein